MAKQYIAGMYGGKFLPMHRGHLHCLEVASSLCEKVYLIMFVNGREELEARDDRRILSIESRTKQIERVAASFSNVIPLVIDVSDCMRDGEEDWDAETPLVLAKCSFDVVFSSEPGYDCYFRRAYPWADHVLVDPMRRKVPISATEVRAMSELEASKWMV